MEPPRTQTPEGAFSYMAPIGYHNSKSCGYCGNGRRGNTTTSKRFSYYASASSVSPEFYQDLLDRYWRRSGSLMYRPNQRQSCCPHYTIRLDANLFKPSRDQRQTVNRFNRHVTGTAYSTEVARLHPQSHQQKKKRANEFDLIERIHEAELDRLKTPPEPAHKFAVTLEEDTFTEEKYLVFENYQRIVHKESPSEISRKGFRRFLCDSPIRRRTETTPHGKEKRLGSYHQCYRLDGQLVAIGVLDLLPHSVSAVYFLYHESIHSSAPGKLGALQEIALARECGYRYWYPGYYIHSCPKMRYKIDYLPQYILDPETLSWDVLDDELLGWLDRKPYVSASRERRNQKTWNADGVFEGGPAKDEDVVMECVPGEPESDPQDDDEDDEEATLFASDLPGIISFQQMATIDMDGIALRIDDSGMTFTTSDLVVWSKQSLTPKGGLKASIAELVAAIGPDMMESLCLDFRR